MKKIDLKGRVLKMLRHNADAVEYWNTELEPEEQHDYYATAKQLHGVGAKALALAVLDAWEDSPHYDEAKKGALVMSTLNADTILETLADLDATENGEVWESELVALHRLTSQVEVDQMLQHMGWDNQAQFEADQQEADADARPLLTGDPGPYVGWYVEADETGQPPATSDMEEMQIESIFLISDEGVVSRAEMSGWQDPDDEAIVYVERDAFEALPGQPTDEMGANDDKDDEDD